MEKQKTLEELLELEELCQYCPIPEEHQGVHCYGGEPIMCEGAKCPEAYQAYLDDYEEKNGNCI